ncbi:MAG: NlpC/P60 family protein [Sakamotonia sp.]|jgi:cell wall-associated NlpC family hydrolase
MKNRKIILTVGCALALMLTPATVYADTAAQTSPRLGIPVVGSNGEAYANVAISQVSNYVNVRTEPNTGSGIVGKIYNNCAATILKTVDGEGGAWYQIQSGSVNGYIKAEYFITGAEAEKVAKQVGTVYATINTETLRLREEPNTTSATLTLLSRDAEYIATKEEGDFVQIQVDYELSGYVHKDYITQRVEFDQAVSTEEEQKKKEEAEKLQKEAREAIAAMEQLKGEENVQNGGTVISPEISSAEIGFIQANPNEEPVSQNTAKPAEGQNAGIGSQTGPGGSGNAGISGNAGNSGTSGPGGGSGSAGTSGSQSGPGADHGASQNGLAQSGPGSAELVSATRTAIVAYAKQFLGNPYVYGGTSLTEGADCSGFTMKVFEHFGISTGRSSRDQAAKGKEIPIDAVQPGDLLFYASGDYINHVALYIGGGQIIHASTPKNGIMITTAYYRTPYKAVTFLN